MSSGKLVFAFILLLCVVAREKKALKKVPKGTSDYQAAWIIAEQEEEEEEEEDGDGDEEVCVLPFICVV